MGGSVFRGMGYLGEGFRLIREPVLRRFVIIPLVLNVLVFIALFAGLYQGFLALIPMVMEWLPDWAWLQALDWLFWLLYGAVIILLMAYGFVILANLIGSPFYGYLAELTEKRLTGQLISTEDSWRQIVADIPRALWRELQKILYYVPRAALLLILGLIPVINLIGVLLWFGFNSWMMALQYVDYPSDNHRESFSDLKRFLRVTRLSAYGFGVPVALGAMVPLFNLVVVPAAVCGGTAYYVREKERLARLEPGRPARP